MQGCAEQALTKNDEVGIHHLKKSLCMCIQTVVYYLRQGDFVQIRSKQGDADLLSSVFHHGCYTLEALQLLLLHAALAVLKNARRSQS